MHRRVLVPLVLAAAVAACAAALPGGSDAETFAPLRAAADPQVSSNWAGYAISAADPAAPIVFSDVTGTWVEPQVSCDAGSTGSAAFWVGLGGFDPSSPSLEQLGTEAQCVNGVPRHRIWYEVVPAPQVPVKLVVRPGDVVTAAVVAKGPQLTLQIKNVTRRTRFTKLLTATRPLDVSSAEWIAEAPSLCFSSSRCRTVPLANFGTVTFSKAAAIGNDHPGTISDGAWVASPIRLATDSGHFFGQHFGNVELPAAGALPTDLTADGRGFQVSFQASAPTP